MVERMVGCFRGGGGGRWGGGWLGFVSYGSGGRGRIGGGCTWEDLGCREGRFGTVEMDDLGLWMR